VAKEGLVTGSSQRVSQTASGPPSVAGTASEDRLLTFIVTV
jgi:hypothetical protein